MVRVVQAVGKRRQNCSLKPIIKTSGAYQSIARSKQLLPFLQDLPKVIDIFKHE